jgi:hypothetical protein
MGFRVRGFKVAQVTQVAQVKVKNKGKSNGKN